MYESWFISLYSTMYTSLPIQCVGFFEQVSQIQSILTNHSQQIQKLTGSSVSLSVYIDSGIGRECQELSVLAGDLLHWTEEAAFQSFCSVRHAPLLPLHLHHHFLHTYGNIAVLCSRFSNLSRYGGNVCGARHHCRGK